MSGVNSITDLFRFLGKKSELEFDKIKFHGQAAGTAWKYSNALDKIIAIRLIIFLMTIVVFYRISIDYLFHSLFDIDYLLERMLFSFLYLIAGLIFNKKRKLALCIALIPTILILTSWLTNALSRPFALQVAITLILLSGFYFDSRLRRYREELHSSMSTE